MTVDLTKILESKRALRRELATRTVAEKLRMLDAMRMRDAALRPVSARTDQTSLAGKDKTR